MPTRSWYGYTDLVLESASMKVLVLVAILLVIRLIYGARTNKPFALTLHGDALDNEVLRI